MGIVLFGPAIALEGGKFILHSEVPLAIEVSLTIEPVFLIPIKIMHENCTETGYNTDFLWHTRLHFPLLLPI